MNQELDELLQAYDDGTLTESQERRLAELIRTKAGGDQLLRTWWMHGALHEIVQAEAQAAGEETEASSQPVALRPTSNQKGKSLRTGSRRRRAGTRPSDRRRSPFVRFALLSIAAAAILMVAVNLWHGQTLKDPASALSPRVAAVSGKVEVIAAGSTRPVTRDMLLRPGYMLQTSANGRAVLRYTDNSRITLEEESILLIADTVGTTGNKRLRLLSGSLEATVTRQDTQTPMQVVSSHAEATVLGTAFRFVAGEDGTRLEVTEGKVKLARAADPESSVIVSAGTYADTRDESLVAHQLGPKRESVDKAPGLVLHLTFDDAPPQGGWTHEPDRSPLGNDVKLKDPIRVKGPFGSSALGLNGTSSFGVLQSPAPESLPAGNQPVSLAAWARTDRQHDGSGGRGDYGQIVAYGGQEKGAPHMPITRKGVFIGRQGSLAMAGAPSDHADLVGEEIWQGDNRWHHIALTWDTTTAHLYVDGKLQRSARKKWDLKPYILTIGCQIHGKEFWQGAVDDIRVYNRALSAAEVASLAAEPSSED